jgi:hypothetical protein
MINISQSKLLIVVLIVIAITASSFLVWNIMGDSEQIIKQRNESVNKQEDRIKPITIIEESGTPLINTSQGDDPTQKVGPEVIEAVQTEGQANVMIMLTEPPSRRAPRIDLSIVKQEIAQLQDQVLSTLDSQDFQGKQRYQAIPALAGKVTKTGLAKLVAHPNVVKIDLDVGGTGSE